MCFIKPIYENSPHLETRIATRPIKVLKIGSILSNEWVKGGFISIVYPKIYIPGHIETLCCSITPIIRRSYLEQNYIQIERGFHSYRYLPGNIDISKEVEWKQYIYPYSIGIFEIPTGSIYYSDDNHFVSDAIKLIEVITSPEEWEKANFKPELIL